MPPIKTNPLTNIGTTRPPRVPLAVPIPQIRPVPGPFGSGIPTALPIGTPEGQAPGPRVIATDPLWTSRWQPSATQDPAKRPFVLAYRYWAANVKYQTWGPDSLHRIDFWFRNGKKWGYKNIDQSTFDTFRQLESSVGQFWHQYILVEAWRPGAGARFPDFEVS